MCVKQIDYAIKYFQQLTCRRSPPHPFRAAHFFPSFKLHGLLLKANLKSTVRFHSVMFHLPEAATHPHHSEFFCFLAGGLSK